MNVIGKKYREYLSIFAGVQARHGPGGRLTLPNGAGHVPIAGTILGGCINGIVRHSHSGGISTEFCNMCLN